jgi:sugar lactone lactonase YvrE
VAGQVNGTAFNAARGLAYDGSTFLYLVDDGNCVIRQIEVATGTVVTFAGLLGSCGSFDAAGTAARFNLPEGLAYDGQGNLYVADTGNSTIRQIVIATQMVTTLAGAAGVAGSTNAVGTAARFFSPYGVTSDGQGNLFIADSNNQIIRQLVLSSLQVSTLAGQVGVAGEVNGTGPAARFCNPGGIAADGAGNVYVSDSCGYDIRRVTVDGGVVTTFAGTPGVAGSQNGIGTAASFSQQPQALVYDGVGNLYLADQNNAEVRRIELSTATVSTVAGVAGKAAVVLGPVPGGLDGPWGVAASAGSPVFISDTLAEVVLEAN